MLIKNGKVWFDGELQELDVLIEDGRIKEVGEDLKGGEVMDATGLLVLPGMIDSHVHFREPGQAYKEDFRTGSMAAAAGGVTTVLAMPNTKPPITDQETLDLERDLAEKSIVNYGLYLGATADNVEKLDGVDGGVAVKAYIGSSTGDLLLDNPADLVRLFENTDRLVVAHAEDEDLLKYFNEKYEGKKDHHLMRDNLAALIATSRVVLTADYLGKNVHIAHMSSAEEVEFLRQHKTGNVSCEVCPHHLFLTKAYFEEKGNYGKMNPPLRKEEDVELLWEGIKDGIIDVVATDHAPHTKEEKSGELLDAPSGVPGVQTMVPLMLNAVNDGKLELGDVVRLCAENPAEIFRIKDRGRIREGYWADLVLVDMDLEKEIRDEDQLSKCGWTPFHGLKVKGWPVTTIVNGCVAYEDDKVNEEVGGMKIELQN